MSQAEDLLNGLEEPIAMYSVNPESEPHIVINPDKSITVPDELKHIAVQGDHNIETVTFDCPRYWDGHDLSKMSMRIVYQRPDGHREPHPVENLDVDEIDKNIIHFDWTISGNVTLVKGSISFLVCAKLSNVEGLREREWHTRLNQDLVIDEGMDCSGEEIVEQNPDIIESILARLEIAEQGGVSEEVIAQALENYLDENPVQAGATAEQAAQIQQNKTDIETLIQAKESGEFKGEPGDDYVLTEADKTEIAEMAAGLVDVPEGGTGAGIVVSETAPEDTSVLWVDTSDNEVPTVGTGWTAEQINLLDQLFDHIPFKSEVGGTLADALIASLRGGNSSEEEPDEPVVPEVTLSSISATYSGGDVAVGTAVADLTGIVVTAHYSDGTSKAVTGYTLSGTIAEGSNTITVSYQGKTATFAVTGVAESGGETTVEMLPEVSADTGSFTAYSDGGTTSATLKVSGSGGALASAEIFEEDTKVKITIDLVSGKPYVSHSFASTDWDGNGSKASGNAYYAEDLPGSGSWTQSPKTFEYEYTVRAGYRLLIANYFKIENNTTVITVEKVVA